ncbi:MAG: chaperone modulator CbpM [Gammaproteobacteria bacterium]
MTNDRESLLTVELLDEDMELTLAELCQACSVPAEQIVDLVGEGIIEPLGQSPRHWRFQAISVRRVRCALRLQHDLGVNLAGAALALELLEELERLRMRG